MSKVFDKTFFKLIPIAQKMIILMALKGFTNVEVYKKLEGVYNRTIDKRVLVLDKKLPFRLTNFKDSLFSIYPSPARDSWTAASVFIKEGFYGVRVNFPKSWAGKSPEELQKITGVKDARFCHSGRWIISADSKEGVLEMVNLALKEIESGREKVRMTLD
jgi:uncharacterized UPF0160 family protein